MQCIPNTTVCAGQALATCSGNGQTTTMTGCEFDNASASCRNGQCAVGTCDADYGNCNSNDADGCETPLNTTANCGSCGERCPARTNASPPTCSNGQCMYSCNAGYRPPNCDPIECGELPAPANGRVALSNGTRFGSRGTYTCNQGFELEGAASRMCESSGSWSGSAPTCMRVTRCGDGVVSGDEECDPATTNDNWTCNDVSCKRTGYSNSTYKKYCQSEGDCASAEVCAFAAEAGAICMAACSGGSCVLPSGYSGSCVTEPTSQLASGCLIRCSSNSDCPPGVPCQQGGSYCSFVDFLQP